MLLRTPAARRCWRHTGRATCRPLNADGCAVWSAAGQRARAASVQRSTPSRADERRAAGTEPGSAQVALCHLCSSVESSSGFAKQASLRPARRSCSPLPTPPLPGLRKERQPPPSLDASLTSLPLHMVTPSLHCHAIHCPAPPRWGSSTGQQVCSPSPAPNTRPCTQ